MSILDWSTSERVLSTDFQPKIVDTDIQVQRERMSAVARSYTEMFFYQMYTQFKFHFRTSLQGNWPVSLPAHKSVECCTCVLC